MPEDPTPPATPSPEEDRRRIAADEERLDQVADDIEEARRTHEATKKSWQSGMIPGADGEGTGGDEGWEEPPPA